ncbi:MAG: riboflavin synthase [Gammaproteobacteria bacterium]|nr:riboflavin synthase [Gammaproteobacteria bacterium]
MFSGIVQAMGKVEDIRHFDEDLSLTINVGQLDLSGCRVGDSIAVSGVCLTAVNIVDQRIDVDVSAETLARTLIGSWSPGIGLNLELAVTPNTVLGGHLVTGHVDGIATLVSRRDLGRSVEMTFDAPSTLARYIASKGAICLDGISLTVNEVKDSEFDVNIVPHTSKATTLSSISNGDGVHLEVDIIVRYLERLMSFSAESVA